MKRFQRPFFLKFRKIVDPDAIMGPAIRKLLHEVRIFSADPNVHPKKLETLLQNYLTDLNQRAVKEGKLPSTKNLLARYKLDYDIYTPQFNCFIEIDERQHFSAVRLERVQASRRSPKEANYPAYFWENALKRLIEKPAFDRSPPHRDEQRAYLDLARELIPPYYGLNPTIRIDQYSLVKSGLDEATLVDSFAR